MDFVQNDTLCSLAKVYFMTDFKKGISAGSDVNHALYGHTLILFDTANLNCWPNLTKIAS